METLIHIFAPMIMFASSLMGFDSAVALEPSPIMQAQNSVELGLYETSPNGEEGGLATPASGCGIYHDGRPVHECSTAAPTIDVNLPIVRSGDPVTVSWDPRISINCVLSETVTRLTTSPNPSTAPNANAAGSRVDMPTAETTYTITCQDTGNADSVTVKVLPRVQET